MNAALGETSAGPLYYFSIAARINHHKFSGLKQHKFIITQFYRSEVWVQCGLTRSSA